VPAAAAVLRTLDQPPRLVGRSVEREALADPSRQRVALAGEPGVGKTRLLEEASPAARWIACREGLESVAFAPAIDWLRDHLEGLPELGAQRRDLARLLPELGRGELMPAADPAVAKPRLLDALAVVLEHGTSVVVFDDLQWADAATRELVLHLARRAAVRLHLAYRSNEVTPALEALLDALDADGGLRRIALAPLSPEAVRELMADLTRSAGGPPKFSAWLHRRTGGNPFFALQTLRALFESGRLHAHADGWSSDLDTISVDYSELEVPAPVADLVRRRVNRLSDTTRRVLAVVAVLGSARDIDRIAAATGLSPWAAAEAIVEAQAAGLLGEARFAHDVIRHGVIEATPEPLRRVLHASVARIFDAVLPAAEIAAHWWAAGDPARGVEATLRAAEHDRHAGLPERGIELLEGALAREPSGEDQGRLQAGLARLWLVANEPVRAEAAARQVLREPALPRERALAFALIAELRMKQGRLREAEAALEEAAASDPDEPTVLIERTRLAQLEGRVSDMVRDLERQRDQLRRRAPGVELMGVLTSLGAAYDELGQADRGLPLHEEAWQLAERLGARYAQVEVAINLLWSLSALKRDADAVAIAERALALGEYDASATLRNNLAWSLAELGRIDAASVLYEQLAAGADPTLALIARARLTDLQGQAGKTEGLHRGVQGVLEAMPSTEVYMARAAAALPVLRYGDEAQVRDALAFLRPQPLDPWLFDKLAHALRGRGIDPSAYLAS
jgi:tetratricopeptide (TPR) repeat protein